VNTPLAVCEQRDVKGLYAKARKGEIKDFTGISSPFEEPKNPAIVVKTNEKTVQESVTLIVEKLKL
jgi:adenylylsulfate kinase